MANVFIISTNWFYFCFS